MDKELRNDLILNLLFIIIGVADIALFWFRGIVILHPFTGLVLALVGFFLFMITLIKAIVAFRELNKPIEKIENQDKLYEKDGWESCGCGMYILTSAKIARDEEIKRKADFEAYMKSNFPNKKKEENK